MSDLATSQQYHAARQMERRYSLTRTLSQHPVSWGIFNGIVSAVIVILFIFHGATLETRVAAGVLIGIPWGVMQGMSAKYWKTRL